MTENKICPIMSRPKDCDPIYDDKDRSLVEKNGFYIIDDVPWENVFLCQREKCMAWHDELVRLRSYEIGFCEGCNIYKPDITCTEWINKQCPEYEEPYCLLIGSGSND